MDTSELLRTFLQDANSGNLKTSQYPKEFKSLKMKVSFGQGVLARVPWISFFTPEMSTSNGFYPVYLFFRSENKLILSLGVSETHTYGKSWQPNITAEFPLISEVIQNPPRYGDSWAFKTYEVGFSDGAPVLSSLGQVVPPEVLEQDLDGALELFAKNLDIELADKSSSISAGLFYMEKQLEDFILTNWEQTEFSKSLDLIYEDGVLISQQYRTEIGPIDILAKDKSTGDFVVIELKRNQSSDDTLGQIMRYMGWVSEKLENPGVRGIIVAGKFDRKLEFAQKLMPTIQVYLYEVDFKLKPHSDH